MRESVEELGRRIEEQRRMREYPARLEGTEDIPAFRYSSPDYLRLEHERVFRGPVWLLSGREEDLPGPGAYYTFETGLGGSIVVLRNRKGELRAFHNSCPHRGTQIVEPGRGTLERLRCPYHLWMFDLDGRLTNVQDEQQFFGFDRGRYGLHPVKLDSWAGWIWLSLHDEPPPLLEYVDCFVDEFAPYELEKWVTLDRDSWTFPVNWKVIVDAFNEVYHIPQIHPQSVTPFLDLKAGVMDTYDLHTRMTLPFKSRNSVLGVERDEELRVRPPELDPVRRESDMHYFVFPNVQFNLVVTYATLFAAWPLGPRETRFDYAFLGIPPIDEPQQKYYGLIAPAFRFALEEDFANFPRAQAGIDAQAHTAFPLNHQEVRIRHFHRVLERFIGS